MYPMGEVRCISEDEGLDLEEHLWVAPVMVVLMAALIALSDLIS